jgi:hypothetical protein
VLPADVSQITHSAGTIIDQRSSSKELVDGILKPKKKRAKGWDGEGADPNFAMTPLSLTDGMPSLEFLPS